MICPQTFVRPNFWRVFKKAIIVWFFKIINGRFCAQNVAESQGYNFIFGVIDKKFECQKLQPKIRKFCVCPQTFVRYCRYMDDVAVIEEGNSLRVW